MLTFNEFLEQPNSTKILLAEIDAPLSGYVWLNHQPGIWYIDLTPGTVEFADDFGNTGFWSPKNDLYYNIQSLNVGGVLYDEETSLANVISTEKTWYYDTDTTFLYCHFEDWNPPEYYSIIAPGAAIGFTNTAGAYFEDIYYEPLILSAPNISKKRDALFFGVLQFTGGSITFDNKSGYFDSFADLDLYGQPVRLKFTFPGLAYTEAKTVYTAKVKDFTRDFSTFKLNLLDARSTLSREFPLNKFTETEYPSMDEKYYGYPIPEIFGEVIKVPAYYIGGNEWVFADTTLNSIDSGIAVYDADGNIFSHTGTGTNGKFGGTAAGDASDNKLTVTCSQTTTTNGLAVIEQLIEEGENITYASSHYDLTEWEAEKTSVANLSMWLGKGQTKKTVKIIEEVCKANQGIFDILADGRFTFRTESPGKLPLFNLLEDEILTDPKIQEKSDEYLTSVTVGHSRDYSEKEYQEYTNTAYRDEVYARYRQYKDMEKPYNVYVGNEEDAIALSETIMNRSKTIPTYVTLSTKPQNIEMRIMDNVAYECKRQSGGIVIEQSKYECNSIIMNLSTFQISTTLRKIGAIDTIYKILMGREPEQEFDYYYGGTPSDRPINILRGRIL